MILFEAPPTINPTCITRGCEKIASFDCPDCDSPGMFCQSCLLDIHRHHILHRPRKWNGEFFETTSFHKEGLVVNLGHGEAHCPHMMNAGGPYDVTVVDVNGVHLIRMGWCRCASGGSYAEQLLSRRMVPTTILRPRTAFTFRLLKLFHMMHHTGRINPWDFSGAMHRLTDNVNPQAIPVNSFHQSPAFF